ncbi:hypothetical protein [Streptosporangium sp. NPDC006007]|uniref:hypothetical protein n=1 Tax=Streptosporangium sp. NPDC006007 TaxID=3154575 RepID=UPI0033B5FDFA
MAKDVTGRKVQRLPGADGRTVRFHGTRAEAEAYVRMLATHPDPDNCDDEQEDR